ncbi:MAG: PP2C family protein-serine/threonine phosphatase [bacterium]
MADPRGEPEPLVEGGQFRAEYEREMGQWLRRRLGYLCIAYAVFQVLSVTALTLSSTVFRGVDEEPKLPPRLEQRADEAERRAEAGLPLRPVDARALAALEAEKRRLERERGAEAVVSTIDAFGTLMRDIAADFRDERERPQRARRPARERIIDKWWLEDSPGTAPAVARPEDAPGGDALAADDDDGNADEAVATDLTSALESAGLDADSVEAAAASLSLPWWIWVLTSLPMFGVLAWFGLRVRPKLYTRGELVSAASRMILSLGLLNFGFECVMLLANPSAPVTPLFSIFVFHLTASLFLPWSWRESLKPIVPLLVCWLLLRLGLATSEDKWFGFVGSLIGVPFLFAPALFLCYARLRWHQRQFKSGFVGRRFLEMRREFIQARAVHESLFPKPEDLGWLRFDFGYRPAADIGGDFIHSWTDDNDRFHVALIDVTGHGLASAMTVARIHGEIERLRDEHPDDGPARMLSRLNRYFQRLLSRYRLFATAVLITIDPRTGEMRYASAGHPPVFVRTKNGLRELESTTFLLGAVDGETFGSEEVAIQLEEGDRVILYTDGAYDAKSPRGERFGLDRLREILQRPAAPPSWTAFLMNLVETFEAGMPEDDLLIAEIAFRSRKSVYSSVTGDDVPVPRSSLSGAAS